MANTMNRPAPVELCHKNMRFLITHNPTDSTLPSFTEDLKRYGATTVVRVCDVTYDKTQLEKDGITVVDWAFEDGAPPPSKLVDDWLNLLKNKFTEDPGCCVAVHCVAGLGSSGPEHQRVLDALDQSYVNSVVPGYKGQDSNLIQSGQRTHTQYWTNSDTGSDGTIGTLMINALRAPVLVALALIESGMKYEEAVQFIRQKRRGAINSKQLTYLEKYRSKQRLRFKDSHTQKNKCCTM